MAEHKRHSPVKQAHGRMRRAKEAIDAIFYDMTVTREQVRDGLTELKEYIDACIGGLTENERRETGG